MADSGHPFAQQPHGSDASGLTDSLLTKQQERAMRGFLWVYGREGFTDETHDGTTWDMGVRPWPTMENLCKKGLIEAVQWWGPEEGWEYCLTDLGRDYMRFLVARDSLTVGKTLA